MVPKLLRKSILKKQGFRAVLFRMVPKPQVAPREATARFRAVLFRMVPKQLQIHRLSSQCFRAVLFRMVPKRVVVALWQV